jgi:TPR repeat protein
MDEISTGKKNERNEGPISNVNFNSLINKINEITSKGRNVDMKNKEQFLIILKSTSKTLQENKNIFESLKSEENMIKLFDELENTIEDVESKLNKLALIKFCKSKAEKYLKNVSEKLENINMILLSYLASRKNKHVETKIIEKENKDINLDKEELLEKINELNSKINSMELNIEKQNEENLKLKAQKPKKQIQIDQNIYEALKNIHGLTGRINYKNAFEKFEEAVNEDDNNTEAKLLLAEMYEKGLYKDKSYPKALELYIEASNQGNSRATYMIGNYAENKLYDDKEQFGEYDETAIQNYSKASEEGNSDAYAKLGLIYEKGLLNQNIDLQKAEEYYQKSVDIDENPIGLNGLGNLYYNSNPSIAVDYFKKAALNGNLDALNNLGICYEYGKGVEQNYYKALEYYKKSSDKNHLPSMINQAILLIKINIINNKTDDLTKAYHLLNSYLIYDKTNPEVYYYLGFLYENGFDLLRDGNIIQNPYMAFLNYKNASDLGNIKAKTKIGVARYNGINGIIPKDEETGISLIKEASNNNDQEATDYLNSLKEMGKMNY